MPTTRQQFEHLMKQADRGLISKSTLHARLVELLAHDRTITTLCLLQTVVQQFPDEPLHSDDDIGQDRDPVDIPAPDFSDISTD